MENCSYKLIKNISVINVTRVKMSENRQAINKIIGSLSLLDSKIGNITQALEGKFFRLINLSSFTYKLILLFRQ